MRAVAQNYGIPKTTFHDHLRRNSKKVGAGGPTVLTPDMKREIALTCTTLADMGYGLTKDLVEVVIYDYLKENDIPNPFT